MSLPISTLDSLMKYVVPEPNTGCWLWEAGGGRGGDYGTATINNITMSAHSAIYTLSKGPIPEGKILDHKCRVTWCVNPDHLEPVTHQENVLRGFGPTAINARKTHCPRGHEYDITIPRANGKYSRYCRVCANENNRRYRLLKSVLKG